MSSETNPDTADAQSTNQSNSSAAGSVDTSETTNPDASDTQPSSTKTDKTATDTTTPATTDQEASDKNDQDETDPETEQPAQAFTASIEARHLMQVVDLTRAIVDEARFHLDETGGLSIQTVDSANVASIELTLPPDAFASFTTSGGLLGVDLTRLDDILSLARVDDLIQLALNPNTRTLTVQINSLEYTLALIDLEVMGPPCALPEIDLPAHACLDYGDFDRALTAAEMVANHITLRLDPDTEQFVAEASGDTDDVELTRDVNDLSDATIKPANSLFSLDYLTEIKTPIPTDTTLDISLGEDLPATIDLTLGQLTAQYALAPRIKTD